jgi:hypothetical protein
MERLGSIFTSNKTSAGAWRARDDTHAARHARPQPAAVLPPGPSALSRLLLAAALAIFLMAADHRFALIQPLRNALATGLPAVRVLGLPVALVGGSADYIGGLDQALARNQALQRQLTAQAEQPAGPNAEQENAQLRGLLGLRPATRPAARWPRCSTRPRTPTCASSSSTAARSRA